MILRGRKHIASGLCLLAFLSGQSLPAQLAPLRPAGRVMEDPLETVLSPELVARLAEQFAPVFVFHPDEEYLPANPLFPLEQAASALEPSDTAAALALLGTAETRVRNYRALSIREKAELATLYYRAYPARQGGRPVIVLEFWLYYVQNDYRVRGNTLPFWFDGSHPNDLEHVHLVLGSVPRDGPDSADFAGEAEVSFQVEEILTSAHQGNIPANRFRYTEPAGRGASLLVELGSHAMAPDIDEDGVFTPAVDGDSGHKMLWGIRDRGITWFPYSASYMNARSYGDGPRLEPGVRGERPGVDPAKSVARSTYRLVPAEALVTSFRNLGLADSERAAAFENEVHWFRRMFGRDNGSSDALLMPPRSPIGGDSVGIEDLSASERGILAGTTLSVEEPGFLVGGRYAFLNGSKYVPDLVLEADAILTTDNAYLSSQFLLSYPIDGSTRIFGGREVLTDSIRFDRRQWNWIGSVEVRLGGMRIQAAFRSVGPLSGLSKEFRLTRFF